MIFVSIKLTFVIRKGKLFLKPATEIKVNYYSSSNTLIILIMEVGEEQKPRGGFHERKAVYFHAYIFSGLHFKSETKEQNQVTGFLIYCYALVFMIFMHTIDSQFLFLD